MKKYLVLLILVLLNLEFTQAQFIRKWEKSAALGNLPSWFSSTNNNVGGIAFTIQNSGPRLLVITDKQTPTVIILDALTGDSLGTLNTSNVSGGLFTLNDLATFTMHPWNSTRIVGCNLTQNATLSPFRIYIWEDIYSPPQLAIIDSISIIRLGDHISAYKEPAIKEHITSASSGNNKILDYYTTTPSVNYTREEITLSDGPLGSNASADYNMYLYDPSVGGGICVNSDMINSKIYSYPGILKYIFPDSVTPIQTNAIKYYSNGTLSADHLFYTTFNYQVNRAELAHTYIHNWQSFENWGSTSSLGNNPNPTNYGDVDFSWRTNDSLLVFVLAGNNGIGCYHANGFYLPVELISFTAEASNSDIVLNWVTASEVNNKGFEVERKSRADDHWENVAFIQGKGTTTERTSYTFRDSKPAPGNYSYRLKQIDFDGSFEYSETAEVSITLPFEYSLEQNYPNPFNPGTKIRYSVPEETHVSLSVFNILGQEIIRLKDEVQKPGYYEANFDASSLSSGIYLYTLQTNQFTSTKKMMVLK